MSIIDSQEPVYREEHEIDVLTKRIGELEQRIEQLESLVRDMYESLWTVSESWAYDAYHERMDALGLMEREES